MNVNTEVAPSYPVLKVLSRIFMNVVSDFQVNGLDNLIEPPFLMIGNHLQHPDTIAFSTLPANYYAYAAKKVEKTFIGWVFSLGTVIWIEQDSADTHALKLAIKALKAGNAFALYPEGHRSKKPGMQEGKEGAAFIATRAKVPIIPCSITGTHRIMKTLRPKVRLTIGKPFTLPETRAKSRELRFYTDYMMCTIANLLPSEYRGVYADHPLVAQIAQHGTQVIDTLDINDFVPPDDET
jgi:1-acyl-sn-glycerol-3-phosphate acyltransferase